MALVRKKVKGKVYLYEVRYVREGGKLKQKWKLIGRVTNSISNSLGREPGSAKPVARVQIPAVALNFFENNLNRASQVTNTSRPRVTNIFNNFCNLIHEYENEFKSFKYPLINIKLINISNNDPSVGSSIYIRLPVKSCHKLLHLLHISPNDLEPLTS